MAYDPYYSSSPSDSGLLDELQTDFTAGPKPPAGPGSVPSRGEYVAPEPGAADASAPEESLRDVPLPEGYLSRLRRFVGDL